MIDKTLKIPTYDECVKLVKHNDNFYSTEEIVGDTEIISFNYRLASFSDFNQDFARNTRGIGFNKNTKKLMFLPLIKFFNYNENEFTSTRNIEKKDIKYVTEKMDGSLIIFYTVDYKLCARTQNSNSSWQAEAALKIVRKYPIFASYLVQLIESKHLTPVFEFISPENRIVVKYDKEELIFIGCRNMVTGEFKYTTPDALETFDMPDITGVKYYEFNSVQSIYEICKNTKKDMEGFVVQFTDGDMVKIKTDEYFHLHKVCAYLNNISNIAEIIINGTSDDVKSKFCENEGIVKAIEEAEKIITPAYNYYINKAKEYYENNKELARKEFAIKAKSELDNISFGLAMNLCAFGKIEFAKYNNSFINKKLWEIK